MPYKNYFLYIFCIISLCISEIRGQGCNGAVTATVNPKEYCFEGNPISVVLNGNIIGKSCEFFWTPDGNLDNPNSLKPTATIDAPGMYMYTLYGILKNPIGGNLIINGSFESGNTGFTSEYSYVAPVFNALQPEGIYTITNPGQTAASVHSDFSACQPQAGARYMVINGTSGFGVKVWCQTVPVSPNTGYLLSAYATSVHPSNPAILQFTINGELLGNNFGLSGSTCAWQNFFECWYSKTATTADICIVNQNLSLSGNDFAIDNITMTKAQTDSCKVSFKVVEPVQKSKIATICKGETYKLGTATFTDPGYYTDIRVKGTGPCDTIYSLDLNVIEISSTILDTVGLDCNQKQMKLNAYAFVNNNQNQFLTYKWTASAGGNIVSGDLTLNPLINKGGKYTFVTTYKLGTTTCRDTNSITITNDTIKPKVNILPALDTINCQKSVIPFTATSNVLPPLSTLKWTLLQNAHFLSGDTTLVPVADSAGIYILSVKNLKNGCIGLDTSKIFKDVVIPVFGIAPADTLSCSKDSILLASNLVDYSKYSYLWKTQNGILDKDIDKHATWVKSAGTYTLYVQNIFNKCVDSVSIEVFSDTDVPVAFVDAPLPLNCTRKQVTLDGNKSTNNPNIQFSWQTLNGNIVSGGNSKTPIVDKEGDYKLSVVNTSNGCNKSYTITVGWDTSKPTVLIGQPLELSCIVTDVELDGSASASGKHLFQWTTFDGKLTGNTNLPKATAQSVGTYFLEVTDTLNGCKSILPISVKNDTTKPKALISVADTLNCLVSEINLNGNGSSKGARYTYNWLAISGNILQGETSLVPKIDQKGIYQLVVQDTILGCKDSSQITVTQDIQKPIAKIDLPKVINCKDTLVQINGSNSTAGVNSLKFQWFSGLNGKLGDSLNSIQVSNADTIRLIVQDLKNGCQDTTSMPVVKDVLVPNATVDTDVLLTCKFGQKVLNSVLTAGKGPFGYSWTTINGAIISSNNADSIVVNKDGTYLLTLVDSSNYCPATFTSKVTKDLVLPTVQIVPGNILNCRDTVSDLNATGSSAGLEYQYKWSTINGSIQGETDSIQAKAGLPGDYVIVITNIKNGCVDSATVKVGQNIQPPILQISTPLIINCLNKIVSVDGSQSSSGTQFDYSWSTANGNIIGANNNPIISVDKPGTYRLEITNNLNFCTANQSILVTKSADVPIAAIAKTDTLTCGITTVAIDGSGSTIGGNFSLIWSTSTGVINGNPTNPVVATSKAGTYTLIVTNTQNNCKDTATVDVPQNIKKPTAIAVGKDTINCRKNQVAIDGALSLGAGLSYFWSTTNGTLTANNVVNPTVTKAGLYTLVIEDKTNNCRDTTQVTVLDDFAKPQIVVNQPDTISCKTKNSTVTTTANPNYSFNWSGSSILSGQNSNAILVDQSGTYTVIATLLRNGCTDSAKVVVPENYVVPLSNIQPVAILNCNISSVSLDATGSSAGNNITYLWTTTNGKLNGPATGSTVNAIQSGDYQVLVTNQSNGCTSTKTISIGIDTVKPILSIPTPKEITCTQKTVSLTGNALNSLSYLWTTINGNILGNPNSKTVTVDKQGTYQLVVTDPSNGCKQQSSTVVVDYINYPYADAGPDFSLNCKTNKATLTDLATNIGNFSYNWKNGTGVQISSNKDANISTTGLFVLTVKNQENGCERSDTVIVNQIKPTGLNLAVKSPACGEERGYIDVTGVTGGTPSYGFLYGNLVIPGGPHIPHLLPGTYAITVVDANQCTYATKATINSPTGFELKVNNQVSILPGDSVQLHAEVNVPKSRIDTLIWSPTNTLNLQDIWNPYATPNGVARYTVMAIDTNNCRDSAEIWINIIHPDVFIPNVFSPDSDGANDLFFINSKAELILKVNYLEIFDRWGNKVFTVKNFVPNDPQYGWDGTFNAKILDPGVFVYVTEIEYKDGVRRVLKGDVTLIRN